jgi:hypothetical protein
MVAIANGVMDTPALPPRLPSSRILTWWNRNWYWFIPTLVVSAMLFFAVMLFSILWAIFGMMKATEPYRDPVAWAASDPAVISALGDPVEARWYLSGNISSSGPHGEASLAIPLRGPQGRGTLYVEGRKSSGEWHYTLLRVRLHDGTNLDLTPP